MSDSKPKNQGDQAAMRVPEKPAMATPEGLQVRNASGGEVEAVKAANPNASDGSVKNWALMTQAERLAHAEQNGQDESFALVDRRPSGLEVVAARQMAPGVKLESREQSIVQNLSEVDDRPIKATRWDYKPDTEHKVIEAGLQYQAGRPLEVTEQSLLAKIGSLPLDEQAQVLGAGIKAYSGEMSHQQFRIGVGLVAGIGDGVVGLAQGAESLGKTIIGVAQFSRDVMANDPAAVETAGKAGESLGKMMVAGVHVFGAADAYLGSLGAATNVGDYTKVLRDVSWLGQQINSRWEAMTPEEKTRLTTKLAVENLGGLAVGFGTDKLAKSIKVTEALEALGTEVSAMAPSVRDNAEKLISRLTDELLPQPMGVAPDGRLMPVPRDRIRNDVNVLMSKADDLDDGRPRRPTESGVKREPITDKFPPSERFIAELQQIVDKLSEGERNFLIQHGIAVKPVRRITDQFPEIRTQTAGCFDPSEKTIYFAEEVLSKGKWIQNNDVHFMVRHEYGHAFNAKIHPFGEYFSNRRDFIAAFSQDFQRVPPDVLDALQLSRKYRTPELARDEIFADMYAHSSKMHTNNQYSQLLKQHFPTCLKFLEDMPKW